MNRYPSQTGLGASSIMLILVTLCLTVFSVLALLSARVDAGLSARTMQAAKDYYAAEAQAEERLMQIDDAMKRDGAVPDALAEADGDGYAFSIAIDGHRSLYVRFTVSDGAELTDYRVTQTGDWAADTPMNLY